MQQEATGDVLSENQQQQPEQEEVIHTMSFVFPTSHSVTDDIRACYFCFVQASCCYHHITELEAHGVNRNDVQRLSEAGFCTVEAVSAALLPRYSRLHAVHVCFQNAHVAYNYHNQLLSRFRH
jgi:hypothetical protein